MMLPDEFDRRARARRRAHKRRQQPPSAAGVVMLAAAVCLWAYLGAHVAWWALR
jgi:hypothetical protein